MTGAPRRSPDGSPCSATTRSAQPHWREAPGAAPDDAAATARAQRRCAGRAADRRRRRGGRATCARCRPPTGRSASSATARAGGRACSPPATSTSTRPSTAMAPTSSAHPPKDFPLQVTNLVDQLPNLRPPLLGLFGKDDSYPSPEQVAELDEILTAHDKPHEFHSYDDAGHGFFAVDRPAYRVAAANDGWDKIAAFYATHLGKLTMCTYETMPCRDRRQREGTRRLLVPRHRCDGLLRPPGARDGRAHAQHRLRRPRPAGRRPASPSSSPPPPLASFSSRSRRHCLLPLR